MRRPPYHQEIICKYPANRRDFWAPEPVLMLSGKEKTVPHAGSRTTITSVVHTVAKSLY